MWVAKLPIEETHRDANRLDFESGGGEQLKEELSGPHLFVVV